MMHRSLAVILVGLSVLIPNSVIPAGDAKAEEGFTLLFNGKNLDGWRAKKDKTSLEGKTEAYKGRFKVAEGGVLVIDPTVNGDSYIETTREFVKDVHIKLEFNPGPKCNNDFFLRGTKFDITLKGKGVKEGEWNTLDIIVKGDNVEHKINGETARTSTAKKKSSTFLIRAEFGAIQVKNVQVKE